MRVWDIPPSKLCRQHLLGQHRELHAIHSILTNGKRGYRNHPEVKRWDGSLAALRFKHEVTADEMMYRGYKHHSPLPQESAAVIFPEPWESAAVQVEKLKAKGCACSI